MSMITIRIDALNGASQEQLEVSDLIIAGWTGRDKEAMEEHIAELVALGVKRPARTPMYYHVAARRLTQSNLIEVLGETSSGEAEFVLIGAPDQMLVGLGSDHTDREAETVGVTLSKQMCDKPIASNAWPYDEVRGHWEQLVLRSYATIDGTRVLYQEGAVSSMMTPEALIEGAGLKDIPAGTVMFGGTVPAIGGIRAADEFVCELEDPVLERKLVCAYKVRSLPVNG